jgi:hypothetical protein
LYRRGIRNNWNSNNRYWSCHDKQLIRIEIILIEKRHEALMQMTNSKLIVSQGMLKLRGFFETHGTEVVNMLMEEWKLEEALVVEREEGIEEGLERGLEQVAMAALARGMPPEAVNEITGLGIERIRSLACQ